MKAPVLYRGRLKKWERRLKLLVIKRKRSIAPPVPAKKLKARRRARLFSKKAIWS